MRNWIWGWLTYFGEISTRRMQSEYFLLQFYRYWSLSFSWVFNTKTLKTNLAWSCGHLEAKHISYLDCLMFSFPSRTYCTCNNYLTGLFATFNWLPWDISLHCNPTFHPLEEQVTKSSPIYPLLSIQIDTQQFATFFFSHSNKSVHSSF